MRTYYSQAAASAADHQNPMIGFFNSFQLEMRGFGACPIRMSVWCSLAGSFFSPEKHDFRENKKLSFCKLSVSFHLNRSSLLSDRRTTNEDGIVDPTVTPATLRRSVYTWLYMCLYAYYHA